MVPYLISNLGVAAYGLIPLVTSIIGYVAFIVPSLNAAVTRFLTIDLQRKDYAKANRTFNTAFFALTGVILFIIPFVFLVGYYIPIIFNIPAEQERSAILLFLNVCASFFLLSWSGNFTVQLFSYNRLDLRNWVNIINLVTQTILTVLLFAIFGPNLAIIGWSYLIAAIIASWVSIIMARRVCPYLRISFYDFDRTRLNDLCGMGGWMIVAQVGGLFLVSIDLLAVNLLFGADSAGEYAIALKWVVLIRSVSGVLSSLLIPIALSYYAQGQTEALIHINKSAVKLMGLALALPVGLICGLSPQILTVWVGSKFSGLAFLMILLTAHLSVNLSVLPLQSVEAAYNRVRLPGIVTLLLGAGNIILIIVISHLADWGYYSVAVAGLIALSLKCAIFTPWNAARILGVNSYFFARSILTGMIATILVSISAAALAIILPYSNLTIIFVICASITIAYLAVLWSFCLNIFEQDLFKSCLPLKIRQIIGTVSPSFKY